VPKGTFLVSNPTTLVRDGTILMHRDATLVPNKATFISDGVPDRASFVSDVFAYFCSKVG
jgi:hypothetical protein